MKKIKSYQNDDSAPILPHKYGAALKTLVAANVIKFEEKRKSLEKQMEKKEGEKNLSRLGENDLKQLSDRLKKEAKDTGMEGAIKKMVESALNEKKPDAESARQRDKLVEDQEKAVEERKERLERRKK